MLVQRRKSAFYTMLLGILLAFSAQVVFAQSDQTTSARPRRVSKAITAKTIPNGQKAEITGNITKVGDSSFSVCDQAGAETVVQMTSKTGIQTWRRGIFRGAKHHEKSSLLLGLLVDVKGKGNEAGELVASEIKFHDSAYKAATEVDARAIPIEREQDRMAGQLDETTIVATHARKEAKAAQDSADKAQASADHAQGTADQAKSNAAVAQKTALTANERISALDDFETADSTTVNFRRGSAVLSRQAKAQLDEFASKSASAKGFVIEVSGFTCTEGSQTLNRSLGRRRAESVINYLIDNGKVAPRRVAPPYSGGENNPVASNKTASGRAQNRRAELKLLVSKGIAATEPVSTSNQ